MKLIEALGIVSRRPQAAGDSKTFLLAAGFTPLHLGQFFQAHLQLRRPDSAIEIQTGLYGSLAETVEQAATQSLSGAGVVVEWPDLDPRLGIRRLGGWGADVEPDILTTASASRARLQAAIEKLAGSCPVAVCLPTLPLPPIGHTAGWQASRLELRLIEEAGGLATAVAENPAVRVLNPQRLNALSVPAERWDPKSELHTGFPYTQQHAEAVARLLADLLETAAPRKGLITDLDDTLWRGIVGEIGADGICWDLAGRAQLHGLYQQFLDALAQGGILIGAASKNDPGVVAEAFRRTDLRLAPARVYPLEVHWREKSASVARILQTWNIGADSVVFVDDSPMELAEVRAAHPEIECVQFPKSDPAAFLAMLERLRDLFGKSAHSEEDGLRAESIRRSAALREAAGGNGDALDRFLARAEADITCRFSRRGEDPRAFELVNKTNQFNLNGRRWDEAEWRRYFGQSGAFLMTIDYQDKFGPLGRIAALAGRRQHGRLRVDTWVMSCRAFSRRIEHQCLRRLFDRFGSGEMVLAFEATPRNGPLREFLAAFGRPEPEFRLRRSDFEASCPQLFHTVKECGDDRDQDQAAAVFCGGLSESA